VSDPEVAKAVGGTDFYAMRDQIDTSGRLWRTTALEEVDRLYCVLERSERRGESWHCAEHALVDALDALEPRRPSLARLYSGGPIERTWTSIHRASENLILVAPEDWLRAYLWVIDAALVEHLDPSDPRFEPFRADLQRLRGGHGTPPPALTHADRERIAVMRRTADIASDLRQRAVRSFRNALILSSMMLFFLLTALVLWHAVRPAFIDLCKAGTGGVVCPRGATPKSADLALIVLLGALGGLFSSVVPLVRSRKIRGPYELTGPQALLKAASGATTAILGLLLLQGDFFAGVKIESGTALLAYAAFFGIAQQVVTQLVDRRAGELSGDAQAGRGAV
jgi:hypothetical protein